MRSLTNGENPIIRNSSYGTSRAQLDLEPLYYQARLSYNWNVD